MPETQSRQPIGQNCKTMHSAGYSFFDIPREVFEHYIYKSLSSYELLNRLSLVNSIQRQYIKAHLFKRDDEQAIKWQLNTLNHLIQPQTSKNEFNELYNQVGNSLEQAANQDSRVFSLAIGCKLKNNYRVENTAIQKLMYLITLYFSENETGQYALLGAAPILGRSGIKNMVRHYMNEQLNLNSPIERIKLDKHYRRLNKDQKNTIALMMKNLGGYAPIELYSATYSALRSDVKNFKMDLSKQPNWQYRVETLGDLAPYASYLERIDSSGLLEIWFRDYQLFFAKDPLINTRGRILYALSPEHRQIILKRWFSRLSPPGFSDCLSSWLGPSKELKRTLDISFDLVDNRHLLTAEQISSLTMTLKSIAELNDLFIKENAFRLLAYLAPYSKAGEFEQILHVMRSALYSTDLKFLSLGCRYLCLLNTYINTNDQESITQKVCYFLNNSDLSNNFFWLGVELIKSALSIIDQKQSQQFIPIMLQFLKNNQTPAKQKMGCELAKRIGMRINDTDRNKLAFNMVQILDDQNANDPSVKRRAADVIDLFNIYPPIKKRADTIDSLRHYNRRSYYELCNRQLSDWLNNDFSLTSKSQSYKLLCERRIPINDDNRQLMLNNILSAMRYWGDNSKPVQHLKEFIEHLDNDEKQRFVTLLQSSSAKKTIKPKIDLINSLWHHFSESEQQTVIDNLKRYNSCYPINQWFTDGIRQRTSMFFTESQYPVTGNRLPRIDQ